MKINMTWASGDWVLLFRAETEAEKEMLKIVGQVNNPQVRAELSASRQTWDHSARDLLELTISDGGVKP